MDKILCGQEKRYLVGIIKKAMKSRRDDNIGMCPFCLSFGSCKGCPIRIRYGRCGRSLFNPYVYAWDNRFKGTEASRRSILKAGNRWLKQIENVYGGK